MKTLRELACGFFAIWICSTMLYTKTTSSITGDLGDDFGIGDRQEAKKWRKPSTHWRTPPTSRQKKCMGDLGCFWEGWTFYAPKHWAFPSLPLDREVLNTTFLLYTRANLAQAQMVTAEQEDSILESNFNPDLEVKIIIHGFYGFANPAQWRFVQTLKDDLLRAGDYNVLITNWTEGALPPLSTSVANVQVAGAELANLLNYMKNLTGLEFSKVHLLPAALGCQVAAFAGYLLGGELDRITALDPPSLYFDSAPTEVRLDPTDAKFVDVIHTDATMVGTARPAGHIDFYPNNARRHPGCPFYSIHEVDDFAFLIGRMEGCDHIRSTEFFLESLRHQKCSFIGFSCPNWKEFEAGNCMGCGPEGEGCAVLGLLTPEYPQIYNNDSQHTNYYFKTGDRYPYCAFNYHVTITLKQRQPKLTQTGKFAIAVKGESGNMVANLTKGPVAYTSGQRYKYVAINQENIGKVLSIGFAWADETIIGFRGERSETRVVEVESISIRLMSHMEERERLGSAATLCPEKLDPIPPETLVEFAQWCSM